MSGSELIVIDDKKSNLGADKLKNLHFVICVENTKKSSPRGHVGSGAQLVEKGIGYAD